MKEFNKKDIHALDFMIQTIILNEFVYMEDLVAKQLIKYDIKSTLDFNVRAKEAAMDEFVRYLSILEAYDVCICSYNQDQEYGKKNEKTFQFQKKGGFQNLYTLLKKRRKRKKLEFQKTKVDLVLAEKMLKEYPKTKWIARISLVITMILVILEITKFFNS